MTPRNLRRAFAVGASALAIMASALTFGAAPAFAQTTASAANPEIVVTARKREESVLDVPFSINALSGDQLRERGATNLEDLSKNVASFSVQNLGPGQSTVSIRGGSGGQIARDLPGVKEQVGVYLDESAISLSLFTPDLELFDLNRVEVLRGPQGTLFGAGSLAGTVRYITNRPNFEKTSLDAEAGISQVDDGGLGGEAKVAYNLPLSKNAAVRFVGYATAYPGFIDAVQPGGGKKNDANSGTRYGARVTLLWEPTPRLSISPRIVYQDVDVDGFNREDRFNILANPFTTTRAPVTLGDRQQFTQLTEKFTDEFLLADVTASYDFGPVTLTSVSSYTDRSILVLRDATALTASITGGTIGLEEPVFTLNAPLFDATDVDVFTQELRVASNGEGRFQWVVGAFYSDMDRSYGQTLQVPGFERITGIPNGGVIAGPDQLFFSRIPYNLKQEALFAEGTFNVTEKLSLTAGLRGSRYEEKRVLNFDGLFADGTIGQRSTVEDDDVAPRVMASYKLNDAITLNAQASKGFRLGGINDPLNRPLCNPEDLARFGGFNSFRNETAWNYEAGVKSRLFGRGALTLAAFQTDIEDLQVTITAGSCSSRIIFNAPEARTRGAEAEFTYAFTDRFDIGASVSYNNSEITKSLVNSNGTIFAPIREGNALPSTPEWQGAFAATYKQPIAGAYEGFATLSAQYVGKRYTQLADQESDPATPTFFRTIGGLSVATLSFPLELEDYTLINLRLGARRGNVEAAFYINNISDERAELAIDRERDFRARYGVLINQPRTYGLTLRTGF